MKTENVVVKASFRACPLEDRKKFSESTCLMPISVGQKVHEGDKLSATIKLVNSHFNKCSLLVDDSIQRFTLQIGDPSLTLDKAYSKAIELGDLWLERNKHIYAELTIPYNIKRWDDWRSLPEYFDSYDKIERIYNNDIYCRQAFHNNIEEFISRYLPRLKINAIDKKHAFNNCLQYIKEECAVMCLWIIDGYNFELYPSGRNQAMIATYEKVIKPEHPELLRSVALRFKKHRTISGQAIAGKAL